VLNCFGMITDIYAAARSVIPAESIAAINPLMGTCGWGAAIAIKKRYPAQGKQLIYSLLAKAGIKKVIVVDPDIDVFNETDIEWAISYRATAEDYVMTKEIPGIGLDTTVTTPPNLMSKIGIDATLPLQGDKKGKVETLIELGPAIYKDLDKVNLADYIGEW